MFYKLRFHSMDYYLEFYDNQGQLNMKSHLEQVLFNLIQKAEKEMHFEGIFYTVTKADNQDFEILLAFLELIKPSEDLIYNIMDHLNTLTDEELMSRFVEFRDFAIEIISASEFFGKISTNQIRVFSVSEDLLAVHKERTYDFDRKYKELLKAYSELKEE